MTAGKITVIYYARDLYTCFCVIEDVQTAGGRNY